MIEIKNKDGKLLHLIFRKEDFYFLNQRKNISEDFEPLQIAALRLEENQTFKAHRHIKNSKEIQITQEAWIVIVGSVKVYYYNEDGEFLCFHILNDGDLTVTYFGGHNYKALTPNTLVFEIKNGPYFGVEKDKEFIND